MNKIDLTDSLEKIPVKIFPTPLDGSAFVANIIADLIKEKNSLGEKCVMGLQQDQLQKHCMPNW